MKQLSSFHLATLFAKQRYTLGFFVSVARMGVRSWGLWFLLDFHTWYKYSR